MKDKTTVLSKLFRLLAPGHHTRAKHWNSSKLARWMKRKAGIASPKALSLGGWKEYEKTFKSKSPIVYWIVEELFPFAQRVVYYIPDKWNDVRYYFINRFMDRTHLIKTRLEPGKYHGVDQIMLHGMFEILVDFIEVEKSWSHMMWSDDDEREKYNYPTWYKKLPFLRWTKRFRCPQAGIDRLTWEMSLIQDEDYLGPDAKNSPYYGKPTAQADAAKEQYDLYRWWKEVRPNRADPYDASNWDDVYDRCGLFSGNPETEESQAEIGDALENIKNLELNYDREDEEMLIRLIKLRGWLWT